MNKHIAEGLVIAIGLTPAITFAEMTFSSGSNEVVNYAINDTVRLINRTSITVTNSGSIAPPLLTPGPALIDESAGLLYVTGNGIIEGSSGDTMGGMAIAGQWSSSSGDYYYRDAGSNLLVDQFGVVRGGSGTETGGMGIWTGAQVTVRESGSIIGGYGSTTGGVGVGGANEGLYLRGNGQILGGFGENQGGAGYFVYATSGWGHGWMYDNSIIQGGDSNNRGGDAITVGIEGMNLRMYGGELRGGNGTDHGGNGLVAFDEGTNIEMLAGTIRGGNGNISGGIAYKGELTLHDGEIRGGSGGINGGSAYIPHGFQSTEEIHGGLIAGGFGGEQGGHAIDHSSPGRHSSPSLVIINGGEVIGGDSNEIGGSALVIGSQTTLGYRRGFADYVINGGVFNAGTGSVEDGWLINTPDEIINEGDFSATISIYGGLFGSTNAGKGFGLWSDVVFNIYGRALTLDNGILTGWLSDGNYIDVPVFFADNYTGQFNLHNAAVPLPASAYLLGSGLFFLMRSRARKQ